MKSITQNNRQMKSINDKFLDFSQQYQLGNILRAANARKRTGFPALQIFLLVISTVFQHGSLYMQMHLHPESFSFGKDTVYRFMNSCHINWRHFTTLLASRIISQTIVPLTSDARKNVFIIDDSLFSRSRSKKVELLAKVFDHAHHVYTYGFRMLTLGWSDGNTFLPVNYCLLSSENAKNRIHEASNLIDPRTNGGRQRKLAQQKATAVVLQLLDEAIAAGITAKHVLFDTWFCSPSMLVAVKQKGLDIVTMTKKSPKMRYRYHGEMQSVMSIYKQCKKRRGRSKYLLSVEAEVAKDGDAIPVRLVYVRNRNKRSQYLVLVSTDMSLSEEEIIQMYGKRWNIEVFFKICKSYLRLSRDCRSLSYDAMTAHVAVVFTRYAILAVEQRTNEDMRSLGELFFITIDELPDLPYLEAVHLLMTQFANAICQHCLLEEKVVQELLDIFMKKLPSIWIEDLRCCA